MSQEFAPKKTEMGTRRVVLKSLSAVVSGGSVESRWHVASMCGRVMFIHSQEGRGSTSHFTRRVPRSLCGLSRLRSVIDGYRYNVLFLKEQRWTKMGAIVMCQHTSP